MEALHKQKKPKHNGEWNIKLVAEDGKGQQGLRNEHPRLVVQPLRNISTVMSPEI